MEALAYWTRDDWTASPAIDPKTGKAIIVYKGTATAHGTCDLRTLAKDITNHPEDWALVSNGSQSSLVPSGTVIKIAPLLAELESRTRAAVVAAANSPANNSQRKNMTFGNGRLNSSNIFTETQINAVFSKTPSDQGATDCLGMVTLELCEGLISQLSTGEFDALGLHPGQLNVAGDSDVITQTAPLSKLPLGEWVEFDNNLNYKLMHPKGWYGCENTIEVSTYGPTKQLFYGWNSAFGLTLTEVGWVFNLEDEYNNGLWPWQEITCRDVPGYSGSGAFLDLAKLGMKIFDLRTKPKSAP